MVVLDEKTRETCRQFAGRLAEPGPHFEPWKVDHALMSPGWFRAWVRHVGGTHDRAFEQEAEAWLRGAARVILGEHWPSPCCPDKKEALLRLFQAAVEAASEPPGQP